MLSVIMAMSQQLAEDMLLLGLPFLLSKAADAASDFEARPEESTASTFVQAMMSLKATLDHPELTALGPSISKTPVPTSSKEPLQAGKPGLAATPSANFSQSRDFIAPSAF